ncbi:hypothetical protein BDW22DRAFT_1429143 [Trametopsis cervina]|nr:hypothetical protein BDW22DRAFT_1429143 [Trametopsis cervina]
MDAGEHEELRSKVEVLDESGAKGLRDWAAIRAHLKRHDDEMIGDYEDDINTMLVFAGLFSAVVTSFIIDSYKWLQQDSSQTIITLLTQISSQLADLASPPTADLAAQHGPAIGTATDSFQASRTSVWINCLWVLSLLFGLTAALLGIIIKQWLREYVLWDSVLFPAREAVLLRHIRYDAFERWKVPMFISAIPAMLELALVLFLGGAAILLWTLDSIVAVIVTVFGSLAVAAACSVNILPVFFHRCPYKSAVGWTCVTAWNLLSKWGRVALNRLYSEIHIHEARRRGPRRSESWRQRDLQRNMQWGMPIKWELHSRMDEDMQLEVVELVTFFHALAWVCSSTQDDRLLAKVQQCAGNFHGTSRKHLCLVAGMHAVCQIFHLDSALFFAAIRSEYTHEETRIEGWESNDTYGTYTLIPRAKGNIWQGPVPEQSIIQMVADVLLSVVQTCVEDMFQSYPTAESLPSPEQIKMFMETLCFLLHVSRHVSPVWRDSFSNTLIELWNHLVNDEYGSLWTAQSRPRYPGFKATVFQMLNRLGTVHINETGDLSVNRHEDPSAAHIADLAMIIYDRNASYSGAEDRHVFVLIANDALREYTASASTRRPTSHISRVDSPSNSVNADFEQDVFADLLTCMDEALEHSLGRKLPRCGCRIALPWIDTLLAFTRHAKPSALRIVPLSLIDRLERSFQAGLLAPPGADVAGQTRDKIHLLRKRLTRSGPISATPTSMGTPPTAPDTDAMHTYPPRRRTRRSTMPLQSSGMESDDAHEQGYFSTPMTSVTDAPSRPHHRQDPSSSSSTRPLMCSPMSFTSSATSEQESQEVEPGTFAFPMPTVLDMDDRPLEHHSRGSTW